MGLWEGALFWGPFVCDSSVPVWWVWVASWMPHTGESVSLSFLSWPSMPVYPRVLGKVGQAPGQDGGDGSEEIEHLVSGALMATSAWGLVTANDGWSRHHAPPATAQGSAASPKATHPSAHRSSPPTGPGRGMGTQRPLCSLSPALALLGVESSCQPESKCSCLEI